MRLTDIVVAKPFKERQWKFPAGVGIAVLLFGLLLNTRADTTPSTPAILDLHADDSLMMAFNWTACGAFSRLSPTYPPPTIFLKRPRSEVWDQPVMNLATATAGTQDAYCKTVTSPFINNENTLMYLYAAVLYVDPQITFRHLGTLMMSLRVIAVAVFAFALACCGASVVLIVLLSLVGLHLSSIIDASYTYATYPFFLPLVLLFSAALVLAIHFRIYNSKAFLPLSLLGGAAGALFINLRSTYLIFVLFAFTAFLLFVLLELRKAPSGRSIGLVVGGGMSLFLVGLWGTHHLLADPISALNTGSNSVQHTIGHPLVLALAVPENDLSRREGIAWSDGAGLALARKVDPAATYLGPTYDRALLSYYFGLWKQYPGELIKLYLTKWRLIGVSMCWIIEEKLLKIEPLLPLPSPYWGDGIFLTACLAIAGIFGITSLRRWSPTAGLMVTLIMGAGVLVALEATAVYSLFTFNYHTVFLFCCCAVVLLAGQWTCNGAIRKLGSR